MVARSGAIPVQDEAVVESRRTSPEPALARFGEELRRCRGEVGMTQQMLADLAGLNVSYLSDVENGRSNVSLLNILGLARALGVEPERLVAASSGHTNE